MFHRQNPQVFINIPSHYLPCNVTHLCPLISLITGLFGQDFGALIRRSGGQREAGFGGTTEKRWRLRCRRRKSEQKPCVERNGGGSSAEVGFRGDKAAQRWNRCVHRAGFLFHHFPAGIKASRRLQQQML